MASRLPRLHSSPPPEVTLKRKAEEDDDEALDQPRKLPAIAAVGANRPNRPLQPSRTATNLAKPGPTLPKPLTKPRAPPLTRSATTRGTSAPPPSRPTTIMRGPPPRTTVRSVSSSRPPLPSSSTTTSASDDKRFSKLESKLSSIESARMADTARLAQDMDAERAKVAELHANQLALSHELAAARTHEMNQRRELVHASDEIEALKRKHAHEVTDLEIEAKQREREVRRLNEDLRLARDDLERERERAAELRSAQARQSTEHLALATQRGALQTQVEVYARMLEDLRGRLVEAERAVEEMKVEVREGEFVRRKLHNMVQELKGNIRVFARVRPVLPSDAEEEAKMVFPDQGDHKEIVVESSSESAMGQERKEVYNFAFDHVFEPRATQGEVFEEISMLAQSCTDGYNVCIFAYGQTGSGKSFTMEGGSTVETAGMIPRAVEQVFRVTGQMKSKGWEYTMEGQFLEIYNETINDLLGAHDFDKKKHEIKHDLKTGATRVTDINIIPLHSASQVRELLAVAQKRRTVAATMVNERSSRSHSVFTLRIRGTNVSGEKCEGSLNLVDLAGSERLNVSFANGADKERLKETQSINKSLSALGDVIAALGERGAGGAGAEGKHIPYRNSKLTYLLQNSLSGNSKTLMFLNLSPLAAHLNESLTSLRFATKVNNTTIGTARKQSRPS